MSNPRFLVEPSTVPRDNGVNYGKRKREEIEYTVKTLPNETEKYIQNCRKGKIKPKLVFFDKDDYILRHRQRNTLGWLKEDKCTYWQVEYIDEEGNATGKMTGKSYLISNKNL